jgi:staphylococcal nuclease domain-containing protein 1
LNISSDVATGEKVTESLVSEGLVSVRREGVRQVPELQRLIELEDAAKAAGKGKWAGTGSQVIEFSLIGSSL